MKRAIINMLAAIGFISLVVIALNTANAGASAVSDAYERQQSAERAKIELHKLDYPASAYDESYYVTDPMNGYDEEIALQEQAEKDAVAAHANAFLAKVNGGDK